MRRSDVFPSKYLTHEDIPEEGLVVTIHHVEEEKMRDGKPKPVIYFEDQEKGMVCNVTNWNQIERLTGEEDSDQWADERIMLYASVTTFDGDEVGCIRVKPKKPKPVVKVDGARANGGKPGKATPMTQEEADREPGDDDGPAF